MSYSAVLHVLLVSHIPKIRNTVIGALAVDVINWKARPLAIEVQPRQAMCLVQTAINSNDSVPIWVIATGNGTRVNGFARLTQPCENAGSWAVLE